MGKLQSEKVLVNPIPNGLKKHQESPPDTPPQIPPRMKKKGPALPEKPLHMRANLNNTLSSQTTREPLRPRILNLDKFPSTQREVLVAASKSGRERPVDKRQREPAKLLMPTSGTSKKDSIIPSIPLDNIVTKKEISVLPSKGTIRLEDCISNKKDLAIISPSKSPPWTHDESVATKKLSDPKLSMLKKSSSRPIQPILLIPRNLLTWGSTPVSYALWTQRDVGRGGVIKPIKQVPSIVRQANCETSGTSEVRLRSGSVTRSGSLTSQGSSSSDSGGETFPKSVLKKQKRAFATSSSSKGSTGNRKVDQKKNVTFNAFATVQLMEE